LVLVTPAQDNFTPEEDDSSDSAVHSGEDERDAPQSESCPFCTSQEGESIPVTLRQHLMDIHILSTPQPPTQSPTKPVSKTPKETRCNVSGKAVSDCIPSCEPGNHYAPTTSLKEIRKWQNLNAYKWEPHVCRPPPRTEPPQQHQREISPEQKTEQPPVNQTIDKTQEENISEKKDSPMKEPQTADTGPVRKVLTTIQEQVVMWKMALLILSLAWRYFAIPAGHNPLGAYSTTLANIVTASYWIIIGALFRSSFKHTCCTRPEDSMQEENKAATEENMSEDGRTPLLDELSLFQEPTNNIPEKDEANTDGKDPIEEIQAEMAWMRDLLVQGIACKEPSARSALELRLAHRWSTQM
jgi:hypothetical protein